MSNILSTSLAFDTFTQIVDGLPTCDVYKEYYEGSRGDFDDNIKSSEMAIDLMREYKETFNVRALQIGAEVVIYLPCRSPRNAKHSQIAESYSGCSTASREFILRLMEVITVLCHDIAVGLYIRHNGGIRKQSLRYARTTPPPPPPPGMTPPTSPPPLPTVFFHRSYQNWEEYPHGVADMVGYWAEYRLFGGVMVFDRGDSGREVSAPYRPDT
jgi:hypothetical protein